MKNIKYLFLLAFLILNINAQEKSPKIVIEDDSHDFGEINEGIVVTHNYIIKNLGDAVLDIAKVKASCGCTAANPSKNKLEPGDSTTIEVKFNTFRRYGQQKKYVYIFSNDPDNPQYRVSFTAIVMRKNKDQSLNEQKPVLKLEKNQHDFGKVEEGKVVSYDLKFSNAGNKKLKIERVKTSCGCTAVLISDKVIEPGKTGEINIKLDTSDRLGKMARTITVFSNDPENPEKTIILFVDIQGRQS
ncbi:MAG: DUF1573 domain-containing protein [Ignavibacteria bacterium]|jgi:hypothetical protein